MSVLITTTEVFERNFKRLAKHYPSLKGDYRAFLKDLHKDPYMGVSLGGKLRKVRMAITSKGKGKSGGARVITYSFNVTDDNVVEIRLVDIYDKGERSTLIDKEIKTLVELCEL